MGSHRFIHRLLSFHLHRAVNRWSLSAVLIGGAAVLGTGTLGFMWIESWGAFDSFYMTVITLSTVGFGEVRPLSEVGRLFAVFLILGGVATVGFAVSALGERIAEAPKRRLEARIRRMKDHTIVCGYGRIARPVVAGLSSLDRPLCVIERSREKVEEATRAGAFVLEGDATAEEVLERAGVRRAAVVAALLPSDGDNLSIAMTATGLQPGIRVIARSEEERSRANLERAGARAEDVVSPYRTAGRAVLRNLCSPETARLFRSLVETTPGAFDTGELSVTGDSGLAGQSLAETAIGAGRNVLVLAVQRRGGAMTAAPRGNLTLRPGDVLYLFGHPDDLRAVGAHRDTSQTA